MWVALWHTRLLMYPSRFHCIFTCAVYHRGMTNDFETEPRFVFPCNECWSGPRPATPRHQKLWDRIKSLSESVPKEAWDNVPSSHEQ